MSIIIDRKIQSNQWLHLPDDEPLSGGDVTVTLGRWLEHRGELNVGVGRVGVRLQPGDELHELLPYLEELALIAIEFDGFAEGRGYSQAYLLRERHGYAGELRALGARRDHVMYMERCGINAFEPAAPDDAGTLMQGFDEISARYQPSHDRSPLIFRERVRGTADNLTENTA